MRPLKESMIRVYFPYCLERVGDAHRWVLLNRHYKPLGMHGLDWIDYAPHAFKSRIADATWAELAWGHDMPELTGHGSGNGLKYDKEGKLFQVFFYFDGCDPKFGAANLNAYMRRLAKLARMEVRHG